MVSIGQPHLVLIVYNKCVSRSNKYSYKIIGISSQPWMAVLCVKIVLLKKNHITLMDQKYCYIKTKRHNNVHRYMRNTCVLYILYKTIYIYINCRSLCQENLMWSVNLYCNCTSSNLHWCHTLFMSGEAKQLLTFANGFSIATSMLIPFLSLNVTTGLGICWGSHRNDPHVVSCVFRSESVMGFGCQGCSTGDRVVTGCSLKLQAKSSLRTAVHIWQTAELVTVTTLNAQQIQNRNHHVE